MEFDCFTAPNAGVRFRTVISHQGRLANIPTIIPNDILISNFENGESRYAGSVQMLRIRNLSGLWRSIILFRSLECYRRCYIANLGNFAAKRVSMTTNPWSFECHAAVQFFGLQLDLPFDLVLRNARWSKLFQYAGDFHHREAR